MNIPAIALMALAWLAVKNNNNSNSHNNQSNNLKGFLSDDTNRLIDTIGTLNDKNASKEDKTGAILQMMTNPAVMNLAGDLFGGSIFGNNSDKQSNTASQDTAKQSDNSDFKFGEQFNTANFDSGNTQSFTDKQSDNFTAQQGSDNSNDTYEKDYNNNTYDNTQNTTQTVDENNNTQSHYNDEGYNLGSYSQEARNFFRPIENIASIEATHKLYKLYDDWYSKKRK